LVELLILFLMTYLLGSIPTGYLLVKWVKGFDVRTKGSGNIGMTNVWRSAGAFLGVFTLALDILKGVFTVALAKFFSPMDQDAAAIVFAAFFVLLGNVFPIFLNFKGGKGVGVSVGIFFSLLPMESMAGFVVFILAVLITRMISVGSLLSVTTMLVFTFIKLGFGWFFGLALLAGLLVWWTHRQNIKRILSGTENKIGKKAG